LASAQRQRPEPWTGAEIPLDKTMCGRLPLWPSAICPALPPEENLTPVNLFCSLPPQGVHILVAYCACMVVIPGNLMPRSQMATCRSIKDGPTIPSLSFVITPRDGSGPRGLCHLYIYIIATELVVTILTTREVPAVCVGAFKRSCRQIAVALSARTAVSDAWMPARAYTHPVAKCPMRAVCSRGREDTRPRPGESLCVLRSKRRLVQTHEPGDGHGGLKFAALAIDR
jgi:hypothetical protein